MHSLNSDAAKKLLAEFLHDAAQRGLRGINVIHGKGWRSEGRDGILKVLTRLRLAQQPQVLAFCDASLHLQTKVSSLQYLGLMILPL